ncbi:hypothetical protein SAMN05192583_1213 [Sphingomonas gellani]|uniref:Uncharacterized protein n=1 Tax=Sphingomonas gellani TaxID=1166340 RepID=A0A1H8B8J7_9SPHN|nr:hypothetical protein [Sphingomonas gellani]SEM78217.1 hypothetical protein SAMN05192583_1213 [Sphingomonas gellani]
MRGMLLGCVAVMCAVPGIASAADRKATAAPQAGNQALRTLPIPAGKGWKHAETGLILRASLTGLPRTSAVDSTTDEHDVMIEFANPGLATAATIYIFHPAQDDVAMWFDRADYAARRRPDFGGAEPVGAGPVAFVPPGSTATAALRQIYTPKHGPYRSSALAMLPLGAWLVAVRLSSTEMDPAALDARLTALIAEIGWPAGAPAPTRAAVPIPACPDPIAFRHARMKKPDMAQAVLGSLLAVVAVSHAGDTKSAEPKPWCRDGAPTDTYGVYRRADDRNGYTLALGDAGRVASVYPGNSNVQLPGAVGGWTVSMTDVDNTVAMYPSFDTMPQPSQVMDLIARGAVVSRTNAGSDKQRSTTINATMIK